LNGGDRSGPAADRVTPWTHRAAPAAGLLLALALTIICCWPALRAPFTFDEHAGIAENRAVRPGAGVASALAYRFSPDQARPVFFLSLLLNARLFGPEPASFRATGVLLHLLCGLLLYLLLRRLPGGPGPALAGTVLFLLHPLQSESVLYIWGRSGVLSTLFTLAALAALLHAEDARTGARRLGAQAAALIGLAIALGAKEEAIVAPLLFLIWWTLAEGRPARDGLRPAALLAVPAALFLLLRWALLGAAGRQVYVRGVADNVMGQALVSLRMLRLLFAPAGQSVDHPAAIPTAAPGLAALAGCAALAGLALYLALPARRGPPSGFRGSGAARRTAAGILSAAAGSLIYWLVPLPDLMSERRAYLPLAGAALALSALGGWALRRRAARGSGALLAYVPAAALVAILAPLSFARALVWADPVTLWEEAARIAPGKARPLINLGVLAAGRGDLGEARDRFDGAIALEPDNAEARFNRGKLRLDAGDLGGALADLERAVASAPAMTRARINLGIARIRTGELRKAEQELLAALVIDPGEPRALTNLGEVLRATGRAAAAVPLYRQALESDPSYAHAAARLGVTLESLGDPRGALAAYREYLVRGRSATAADREAVIKKIEALEASPNAAPHQAKP
jgi:tetratricopeptide (TPR) repeat protein